MDFSIVLRKLESTKSGTGIEGYRNMSQFIEDVELIFTNAKMFNGEDNDVHKEACICQKLFHSKISGIIGKGADMPTRQRWKYFWKPGGFKYGIEFEEKFKKQE